MSGRNNGATIKAAILDHQKNCLTDMRDTMDSIWKSIRKINENQDRLTNIAETGKVDVLWNERESRIQEEKDRRRYWTRWIIVTAFSLLLSNFGIFVWFLKKIELILEVSKQ